MNVALGFTSPHVLELIRGGVPPLIGTCHEFLILTHSDNGLLTVGMCNSDSQLWTKKSYFLVGLTTLYGMRYPL